MQVVGDLWERYLQLLEENTSEGFVFRSYDGDGVLTKLILVTPWTSLVASGTVAVGC